MTASDMVMESRYGLMEPGMRATGKTTSSMEEANSTISMEIFMMVQHLA